MTSQAVVDWSWIMITREFDVSLSIMNKVPKYLERNQKIVNTTDGSENTAAVGTIFRCERSTHFFKWL